MLRSFLMRTALSALGVLSLSVGAQAGGRIGGVIGAQAAVPQPLAQAVAARPDALVWVDTDQGVRLDEAAGDPIAARFDGCRWSIQQNRFVTITQGEKTLLSAFWYASDPQATFVPLHRRVGSATVDGTIYRNPRDLSQGYGELYINQPAADGRSARAIRLTMDLTFATDVRAASPALPPTRSPAFAASAAADDPPPFAQATAGQSAAGEVAALVWDDNDWYSDLNVDAIPPVNARFDGSRWTLQSDHTLIVTQAGETRVSATWTVNKAGTLVTLHGRNGATTVDGILYWDPQDHRRGQATLYINQRSPDGRSARATRVVALLRFTD